MDNDSWEYIMFVKLKWSNYRIPFHKLLKMIRISFIVLQHTRNLTPIQHTSVNHTRDNNIYIHKGIPPHNHSHDLHLFPFIENDQAAQPAAGWQPAGSRSIHPRQRSHRAPTGLDHCKSFILNFNFCMVSIIINLFKMHLVQYRFQVSFQCLKIRTNYTNKAATESKGEKFLPRLGEKRSTRTRTHTYTRARNVTELWTFHFGLDPANCDRDWWDYCKYFRFYIFPTLHGSHSSY